MKTIVLTGMMGSGKSTIAKLLAKELTLEFIDIDSVIEKIQQISISEIFARNGESYFRKLEKETIKNLFKPENQIIALGGGAFENQETREFLLNNSTVIYLKTLPENIFKRIKNDTTRPLLCDNMTVEKISKIIEQRKENYESAHLIITTDNKTEKQITGEITGVL